MEVCVPFNTSACQDISSSTGSSTDPHNTAQYNSRDLSMSDLKTCLSEFLKIEDDGKSSSGLNLSPGKSDAGDVVRVDERKDSEKSNSSNSTSEKCFSKCGTLQPLHGPKSSGDGSLGGKEKQVEDITAEVPEVNGSAKSVNQCYSRSTSLPIPLKLVSAMKGSREKQGIPPKKLSVTWAPDVYDPIPTSVSHVPSNMNQRYRSNGKKSGKNKQKGGGKSSRGSRVKDKKQARKNGGGSNMFKPLHDGGRMVGFSMHDDSGVVGFSEPQVGAVDFSGGSPDPFCGSSFLKKSVTKLHFPVAEAT